jgi:hypothetical protein
MRPSKTWIADAVCLLALAGLVALLLVPRAEATVAAVGAETPAEARTAGATGDATPRPLASPARVASLFGWKAPAAVRAETLAPAPEPGNAVWLTAVGRLTGEEGTPVYLFKDTRQGAMVSLTIGVTSKGWTLLEVRERDYLLEFAGQRYVVRQGK